MTFKETIKKFIPEFVLSIYHFKLALAGALFFGFPGTSKKLKIIGVTGTSGKSTTTDFITRILEEAGHKVASISSIRFKIGKEEWENKYKMTMPGRFVIQKFLKQAINANCDFVVLEVTSEGIRQFRHKFINFDTAVFTNLSSEHIESHGSFDKYRNEKLKLFKASKNIHVINGDDKNAKYFIDIPAKKVYGFSVKPMEQFHRIVPSINLQIIEAKNINMKNGLSFEVGKTKFSLNLIGGFNVMNALAAISIAKAYGIGFEVCKKVLENAKGIAGRMEIVNKNPLVVVDYAHTPEQLESVYKSLTRKPENQKTRKLICVLGSCGGGRDKWKRPVLGEIAKKYCSKIFITNEDPYDENPMEIIDDVYKTAGENAEKILDRKKAIKKAIDSAEGDSAVVITGKGSEPWMCVENGKKIPWDDRQIAKDALSVKT